MQTIKAKGNKRTILRLERLMESANEDGEYRVARRLHAVILNLENYSNPDIAKILHVHRSNIVKWIQLWNENGFTGLLEGHRSGRPSCLQLAHKESLAEILDSGPIAYGFASGVWTSAMVARVIYEEFQIDYHPGHVRKLLKELGFSVQRPRKKLISADQKLQSKWRRYTYPNLKKKHQEKTH